MNLQYKIENDDTLYSGFAAPLEHRASIQLRVYAVQLRGWDCLTPWVFKPQPL